MDAVALGKILAGGWPTWIIALIGIAVLVWWRVHEATTASDKDKNESQASNNTENQDMTNAWDNAQSKPLPDDSEKKPRPPQPS